MANREQLTDNQLESVTGGAFNFYSRDGQLQCYVDGVGTFNCNEKASNWIVSEMSRTGAALEQVVASAVEQGLFWK